MEVMAVAAVVACNGRSDISDIGGEAVGEVAMTG